MKRRICKKLMVVFASMLLLGEVESESLLLGILESEVDTLNVGEDDCEYYYLGGSKSGPNGHFVCNAEREGIDCCLKMAKRLDGSYACDSATLIGEYDDPKFPELLQCVFICKVCPKKQQNQTTTDY